MKNPRKNEKKKTESKRKGTEKAEETSILTLGGQLPDLQIVTIIQTKTFIRNRGGIAEPGLH